MAVVKIGDNGTELEASKSSLASHEFASCETEFPFAFVHLSICRVQTGNYQEPHQMEHLHGVADANKLLLILCSLHALRLRIPPL